MSSSNNDEDFLDYVDSAKRKERMAEREARAAQLRQEWRETTWAGGLINIIEKIGISNFFLAIGNSFEEGEDSTSFYLTSLLYKIGIITAGIFFVYILGWIMRMITGDEIVMEQEVVIREEVTRAQVEAEERATVREKKSKSQ